MQETDQSSLASINGANVFFRKTFENSHSSARMTTKICKFTKIFLISFLVTGKRKLWLIFCKFILFFIEIACKRVVKTNGSRIGGADQD